MKVYISGPVTGTEDYKERFERAEDDLLHDREMLDHAFSIIKADPFEYVEIVNPIRITEHLPNGTPWGTFMDVTLSALRMCDAVYMLHGWESSKGARIEKLYAEGCGMKIAFEDEQAVAERLLI